MHTVAAIYAWAWHFAGVAGTWHKWGTGLLCIPIAAKLAEFAILAAAITAVPLTVIFLAWAVTAEMRGAGNDKKPRTLGESGHGAV